MIQKKIMKGTITALILFASLNALSQTAPNNVVIPPDQGNIVKATTSIRITNLHTTPGQSYRYYILPKSYNPVPDANQNNYNYIRVQEAYYGMFSTNEQLENATIEQKAMSFQYFDGLGRLIQSVDCKASPAKEDIIAPVVYDQYGRQQIEYLPYTKVNDGRFQTTAIADQSAFYAGPNEFNNKIKSDSYPFIKTIFESSPLNRVLEKGGPGAAWQPNTTTPADGKTTKLASSVNTNGTGTGQEIVLRWTLNPVTIDSKEEFIVSSSPYPSGSLMISISRDELNREVREYSDEFGKVVLKKVQYVDGVAQINDDGNWILTYYIYDDLSRLRFVLQPEFVQRHAAYVGYSTSNKKTMLDSYSFEYRYDVKGRMIYKRAPGAKEIYMVYDQWDRLVLTQDGNQRVNNKWSFTKYDWLNRPVITGEYVNSTELSTIRTNVEAAANRYEVVQSVADIGYSTDKTYPTSIALSNIFTISYFDDYQFLSLLNLGSNYDAPGTLPSGFTGVINKNVKGLATGSKIRVLDGTASTWLISTTYYDDLYRVKHAVSDDILGNRNRVTNEYKGSTSLVTKTLSQHGSAMTMLSEMEFDHKGRALKSWQTMDGGSRILVAQNEYNSLGQLVEKDIHSTDNGKTFLQSVDYRYNIRGWLKSINNSQLSQDGTYNDDGNDLFGMELNYNQQTSINGVNTDAAYNGNISSIRWKSNNLVDVSEEKIYGFKYDALSRLKKAQYATKGSGAWTANVDLFNEELTYDRNGNIGTLKRNGRYNSGTNALIDNLTYFYNGNQLIAVNDLASASHKPFGFSENMVVESGEYTYDDNGSMVSDQNKGLVGPSGADPNGVLYNHLNLPKEVRKGNGKILYTYDALGVKLKQTVLVDGVETKTTNYVGPIHYENGSLAFVGTGEGRVVKTTSGWDYEYFHKDHLGNTRVVYGYQKKVDAFLATMEVQKSNQEEEEFLNVAVTRNAVVGAMNQTPISIDIPAPAYAAKVKATQANPSLGIGPSKALVVKQGDKIKIDAFGYVLNGTSGNQAIVTGMVSALSGSFGLVSGEVSYSAFQSNVPGYIGQVSNSSSTVPKAYVMYVLYNDSYTNSQSGYAKLTSVNAAEALSIPEVTIPYDGKLYVFTVNESSVAEVYFDEVKIRHEHATPELVVTQTNDYYPFGLTFNSYQREIAFAQDYLYNSKELQNELRINWLDYGARMYMPEVGRWAVVDPLAEKIRAWSPYTYVRGNPILLVDIYGMYDAGYPLPGKNAEKNENGDQQYEQKQSVNTTYNDDKTNTLTETTTITTGKWDGNTWVETTSTSSTSVTIDRNGEIASTSSSTTSVTKVYETEVNALGDYEKGNVVSEKNGPKTQSNPGLNELNTALGDQVKFTMDYVKTNGGTPQDKDKQNFGNVGNVLGLYGFANTSPYVAGTGLLFGAASQWLPSTYQNSSSSYKWNGSGGPFFGYPKSKPFNPPKLK